jgi:D-alanine-D-alanine ligase-like ATP-grasp enzyme
MKACSGGIDPEKLVNNFEVFGMDFMVDANYNVWLIEVNTNPCL